MHRELRKKSVTLDLLWQEYKADHPDGYRYSWFCEHYRQWAGKLSVSMRQTHTPGEKLFVDYAGQTLPIIDGATGEIRQAQLFVAVLGASNYTYAEATWTQKLPDWIASHVRAFEFLGGVSEVLVPDNLKSGVKHASFYDPDLNPTYRDLAAHVRSPLKGRHTTLDAHLPPAHQAIAGWNDLAGWLARWPIRRAAREERCNTCGCHDCSRMSRLRMGMGATASCSRNSRRRMCCYWTTGGWRC